ncbi:MAG TPA: serine/threonine-protein kinase [Polyangia bacterium]|nr:serine/threonine-protein kinase [Polyangia bacterium]
MELGGTVQLQATGIKAGSVLGSRFQIEAAIGEGGSGQVFRAWDRVLGEPVALKILRPDRAREKSWIKRLAREVKVARAIRHTNVCRVFDLGNVEEHWFVSMELASSGTLRDTLRAGTTRPLPELLADARAVCAGLAAIHTVGIVHRDVTPQNVLRMSDGRLVLSDFGLAVEGGDTTVHGGTPSYMPPEAAMGQISDQRSDVWQLGCVLHQLLFGRRPEWESGPRGLALRDPTRPGAPALERELGRLCAACLAANPPDRPASAVEVSARLLALELGPPKSALGRLLGARAALVTVGVVLAGALTWMTVRRLEHPASRTSAARQISPAERALLRALAREMETKGRLEEARSLARLAGPDNSP